MFFESNSMINIVEQFYAAFQRRDALTMNSCYADIATFRDPIFDLDYTNTCAMWEMLCQNAREFNLEYQIVEQTETQATVKWIAKYRFSKTGRMVTNHVTTTMLLQDNKIIKQVDRFNLWRWSAQALGFIGMVLGWDPLFRSKLRKSA